ncbi:hypothetical protein [Paraglaciecola polaris]|uniref:Uncharacterized protein n=1 Tax=Paraglaciecola polaris LMG 21857 TaxID=1129793 RepID=K6ZLN0_9ALTE|nr:hypothetical protein [Paraglaciecola polaris]GAC31242.1 hypothetical protein GPLA_0323 [Paraglaciecola polaris LMG 21857]|tara:strand:- start:191 stop:457 length:267 start_codon:yes stop_codon:yes gene_type:complete
MDISNNGNINAAFASGVQGVQQSSKQVTQAAHEIANLNGDFEQPSSATGASLTDSLVDLKTAALGVEASAKVVDVANDTVGTLLDTFA